MQKLAREIPVRNVDRTENKAGNITHYAVLRLQAKDHEELLAFILGQLIKEKARTYQLTRHQQPDRVTVKVSELDERVCSCAHTLH